MRPSRPDPGSRGRPQLAAPLGISEAETPIVREAKRKKAIPFTLLNLATVVVSVAWFAFACYAIAYLTSH